jgi:hypothetical protein
MSEKYITAVSRTVDGIEWTSLPEGDFDKLHHETLPIELDNDSAEPELATLPLPEELHEKMKGDVIVSLRSSDLLLRIAEFPTADPAELKGMIEFQVDKFSPYSIDQLAISHEVLNQHEKGAIVLMAAAKRSCIDAVGDCFEKANIRIHSIDARVLGWLKLLQDEKRLKGSGTELLIIDDGIDFNLLILREGIPALLRMLHRIDDDIELAKEIAYELQYALTTLDAETAIDPPEKITYWSNGKVLSEAMLTELANATDSRIEYNNLLQLPPLSTGIVRRALDQPDNRIELIPQEWIEHVKQKKVIRQGIIAAAVVTALWVLLTGTIYITYKVRDIKLNNIQAQADQVAKPAARAKRNREKLESLRIYADRSSSALECLLETTRLLPQADIEFTAFRYTKNKATVLGGSAGNSDIVYDYFYALASSKLFNGLQNETTSSSIRRGARRESFSVTLPLPEIKTEEEQ